MTEGSKAVAAAVQSQQHLSSRSKGYVARQPKYDVRLCACEIARKLMINSCCVAIACILLPHDSCVLLAEPDPQHAETE